jgi:hypothetical protein
MIAERGFTLAPDHDPNPDLSEFGFEQGREHEQDQDHQPLLRYGSAGEQEGISRWQGSKITHF